MLQDTHTERLWRRQTDRQNVNSFEPYFNMESLERYNTTQHTPGLACSPPQLNSVPSTPPTFHRALIMVLTK